ncbi:DUF5615 family PIN-like protein [Candidatus Poribacteria bacterium]|nr:DUF5615 family PIN-like protein [Candidatus Poribacteria bacterium]
MIRFLLDEHVSSAIQRQLRRLDSQIDVLRVGEEDAPPKGTLDPEILVWLEQNNYILVTENRNTMPAHFADHLAAGQHVPGILCIRPNVTIGRIIDELYTIWYASSAEEYRDRVQFIPL